jgi:hypothetical protein
LESIVAYVEGAVVAVKESDVLEFVDVGKVIAQVVGGEFGGALCGAREFNESILE